MPQRGIAYQPRVPTLGMPPEEETRVLKERRIGAHYTRGSVFFLGLSLWLTRFPNGAAAAGEGHADHEQH